MSYLETETSNSIEKLRMQTRIEWFENALHLVFSQIVCAWEYFIQSIGIRELQNCWMENNKLWCNRPGMICFEWRHAHIRRDQLQVFLRMDEPECIPMHELKVEYLSKSGNGNNRLIRYKAEQNDEKKDFPTGTCKYSKDISFLGHAQSNIVVSINTHCC